MTLPILLYDVPSRTATGLAVETICRLAALPRIVGLKDATGDLTRPGVLRRLLGRPFRLFSGDDATALDFMALGGDGCISVVSNVAPRLCRRLHLAVACGEPGEARDIERMLMPLTRALFAESNPVPVKWALSLLGRMSSAVRLPLCEPAPATRDAVARALADLHLLVPPRRMRSIGRVVSLCH